MGRSKWFSLIPVLLLAHPHAQGAQWRLTPSLTLRETFTDNINLASNGTSAFVTEINPGISIAGTGARHRVNLNYRMQNIISTQSGRGYDLFHQLQANSNTELIENSIFVDARANAGQTLINPGGTQALNNISNTGNRGNYYGVGISPYWRPHLAGYADGEVRVRYDYITTTRGGASDTIRHAETVNMRSGHRFNILTWNLNFINDQSVRAGGNNFLRRNGSAEIRYRLTRKFSAFVQGGFNDSKFTANTRNNRNGMYYTVGGAWSPSRFFTLEGGYGINSFVTLSIHPTRRALLQGTWRNNKIGTNTGNVYQALIRYNSRRTVWQGRYFEDTSTYQTFLTEQQVFQLTDSFGNPILDPVTEQPATVLLLAPRVDDEVFIRKRGELSFTGRMVKNTFTIRLFAEQRTYQVRKEVNDILGINGNWTWRWNRKTTAMLRARWSSSKFDYSRESDNPDSTQIFWTTSFRVTRRLGKSVNAYIEYRHHEQISKKGDNLDYQENRAIAAITMRF